MIPHVISASLSPNSDWKDVLTAFKLLFTPWNWKKGDSIGLVEEWFSKNFHATAVSFNSARSALFAILTTFGIGKGDEVLCQAFTCVAVPNSILWTGATPVYVDIDDRFNIDPSDARKKITKHTKAIIVQHTFGIPAQLDELIKLAKEHNLLLIEDCAHSLGATYNGKKVGLYGDAAVFSFGRDKVISSVWGGMGIINAKCQITNAKLKLKAYQQKLSFPSYVWIVQQLLHPISFSVILPLYNLGIGKVLLVLLQKLRLLSIPVYPEEKTGGQPTMFPQRYPNALATLLLGQLEKLEYMNSQRKIVAKYYWDHGVKTPGLPEFPIGAMFLRYPILSDHTLTLKMHAKTKAILLGTWYNNIIDPKGVDFDNIGYRPGSCPKAELASINVLNLPTNISLENAGRVILSLK